MNSLAAIIFLIKITNVIYTMEFGEIQNGEKYPKFMLFLILSSMILGGICILIFILDICLAIGILKQKLKLVDAWIHIKKIHVIIKVLIKIQVIFPSSKNDFWPFFKLQKIEFGRKNFVKLIYLISRIFVDRTFLNFLVHC